MGQERPVTVYRLVVKRSIEERMGVVVATLSVTGVVIWWKKRKARQAASAKLRAPTPVGSHPRVPSAQV